MFVHGSPSLTRDEVVFHPWTVVLSLSCGLSCLMRRYCHGLLLHPCFTCVSWKNSAVCDFPQTVVCLYTLAMLMLTPQCIMSARANRGRLAGNGKRTNRLLGIPHVTLGIHWKILHSLASLGAGAHHPHSKISRVLPCILWVSWLMPAEFWELSWSRPGRFAVQRPMVVD